MFLPYLVSDTDTKVCILSSSTSVCIRISTEITPQGIFVKIMFNLPTEV